MRRKQIMERAAVLSKVSAKSGVPFVLASSKPELKHVHIAGYVCTACGGEFAAKEGTEPFCVNCGSEKVESKAVTVAALPETDKTLSAVECKACGTHNVLSDVTAGVFAGIMHCVECGTSLTYETEGLDKPITDADAADIDKTIMAGAGPDDLAGGAPTDVTITDAPAAAIPADLQTTETSMAPTTPAATPTPAAPVTQTTPGAAPVAPVHPTPPVAPVKPVVAEDLGVDAPTDTQPLVADQVALDPLESPPLVENLQDDELIESTADEDQDDELQDQDGQQVDSFVKASLVALVLASNAKPTVTLSTNDNEILAFADGICVARLTKANAGEFAGVLHTSAFQRSILAVAGKDGLKAALAAYPFEAITVNFPQKNAIHAMVERRAVEASTAYSEKTEAHNAEFLQCVSLAASGMTKGFFRKHENALKRGFIDTLTTAGVKGAAKIVDKVFAGNADNYHRTLFTLAADLMTKPVDVRNELASTMGDVNMVVSADQDQDDDQDDDYQDDDQDQEQSSIAHRAEHASMRPARKAVVATTEETSSVSIQNIRRNVGGSFF